ncbi:hypothetical protein BDP27DRAFT_1367444 [Rhodocollybia butyracea]|uniref:Uncharacterized protein n=1 Tax=Rhodocollybia butyracea TaxID=206335 RepID=A0A9P5U2P7_9AGAR|nr:hypothetical protein BDP27DRAFT_1367444 [Rhodocollybia butyracea]
MPWFPNVDSTSPRLLLKYTLQNIATEHIKVVLEGPMEGFQAATDQTQTHPNTITSSSTTIVSIAPATISNTITVSLTPATSTRTSFGSKKTPSLPSSSTAPATISSTISVSITPASITPASITLASITPATSTSTSIGPNEISSPSSLISTISTGGKTTSSTAQTCSVEANASSAVTSLRRQMGAPGHISPLEHETPREYGPGALVINIVPGGIASQPGEKGHHIQTNNLPIPEPEAATISASENPQSNFLSRFSRLPRAHPNSTQIQNNVDQDDVRGQVRGQVVRMEATIDRMAEHMHQLEYQLEWTGDGRFNTPPPTYLGQVAVWAWVLVQSGSLRNNKAEREWNGLGGRDI